MIFQGISSQVCRRKLLLNCMLIFLNLRGQYLWPAAKSLCNHLIAAWDSIKGSLNFCVIDTLELGAGVNRNTLHYYINTLNIFVLKCGMVGLLIGQLLDSKAVGSITFTDHDPGCLQLIQENIDLNFSVADRTNKRVHLLAWGTDAFNSEENLSFRQCVIPSGGFSLIVGSDLIYCIEVVRLLFETVHLCLKPMEGLFILATSFKLGEV